MKGVNLPHNAFAGEIICDAVFQNPVPNAADWYTLMTKNDSFVMTILKLVFIIGLKMIRIDETNTLPSRCNKKQETKLDAIKIGDNDACEIIKEVNRRDNFDKEFDIGLISECEYDEDSNENEEESSGESNNEQGDEL